MDEIVKAKKELFHDLKGYREVVGVAIKTDKGIPYIVVYLSKMTPMMRKLIPHEFKGNKVKHEVKGRIGARVAH